ncbi:ribosome maturation factor RimP [Phytoactinopolyspora halotolerans]|uniref:Ribosome maturation factor RimP n=1 Tax=Phytoactinopolyspora halotolerans TaxID=1981512 RepID=A0A6L9S668_9ACTN|nr:ribosome maturation factor RimP [Phytoactinopolyspora halotolerans]NEE00028.1 ribosome maturation factor RimP [Phytoactinopolyspora halotolerans]
MSPADRGLLQRIVEPVVEREGLDLEELRVSQAGRRSRLQIVVDADGGVDLDRCAEASRQISEALDESDVMGDAPYTLEVSSPGVSRPLTLPRHWSRAEGRLVKVTLTEGGSVTGRVADAGETSVVLDVDGAARDIAYGQVAKARVQVEFNRGDDADADDAETG